MSRWQKTGVVAVPLLGAVAGAAVFYGPPVAEWPTAVAVPGAKTEPVPPPAKQAAPAPAVVAPPGAVAQRRPGAKTLEGTPPAPVRLAGMAQPGAAEGEATPAPQAPPDPQPQPPQRRPAPVAVIPLPEPMDPDTTAEMARTAYPEPLAELSRALEEAKRARAREAAAAAAPAVRQPGQAELAAMITHLTALLKQLMEMQMQDRRDFGNRVATLGGQIEDLNARLALAEARAGFYAVAAGGGGAAPQRPAAPAPPVQAPDPQPRERHCSQNGSPVLGPQSYVVTSASPALATIAHRNPMPNQPPPPEVRVGEAVPCLGRVLGIAQEGLAWVVRTERGPITSGPVAPAGR